MMNSVQKHLNSMMEGVSGQLSKFQDTPIGTTARPKRERSAIWKDIMSLDRETSNGILTEMATMAGHKAENNLDDCQFCKFVKENIGK